MKDDLSLIKKIKAPEVTATMLLGVLSHYSDPRKKIHSLVKKGFLKPIKQGVYLIHEELGLRPYSKEILAQLIYGPSYISLETALSNYGFIPERVTATTSICFGRAKSFSTAVGDFEYHHVKKAIYPHGVQLKEVFDGAFCQYASAEKALLDFIYVKETKGEFKNPKEYFQYLLESHRFDLQAIASSVSLIKIKELTAYYPFQNVQWFSNELMRIRV